MCEWLSISLTNLIAYTLLTQCIPLWSILYFNWLQSAVGLSRLTMSDVEDTEAPGGGATGGNTDPGGDTQNLSEYLQTLTEQQKLALLQLLQGAKPKMVKPEVKVDVDGRDGEVMQIFLATTILYKMMVLLLTNLMLCRKKTKFLNFFTFLVIKKAQQYFVLGNLRCKTYSIRFRSAL